MAFKRNRQYYSEIEYVGNIYELLKNFQQDLGGDHLNRYYTATYHGKPVRIFECIVVDRRVKNRVDEILFAGTPSPSRPFIVSEVEKEADELAKQIADESRRLFLEQAGIRD
jgi:hypothetical protein